MQLKKLSLTLSACVIALSLCSLSYADESRLQRIKDNSDNIRELYGNSIIVDCSDVLHNTTLSQAQITSAWDKVNEKSIRAVEDDIGFVSYEELLAKFESEGGNRE